MTGKISGVNLLNVRGNYPNTKYDYGYGGNGNSDQDKNGRLDIDCSHLVFRMMKDAGWEVDHYRVAESMADNPGVPYEVITGNPMPGDLLFWLPGPDGNCKIRHHPAGLICFYPATPIWNDPATLDLVSSGRFW